jgi:hypothetical protein
MGETIAYRFAPKKAVIPDKLAKPGADPGPPQALAFTPRSRPAAEEAQWCFPLNLDR